MTVIQDAMLTGLAAHKPAQRLAAGGPDDLPTAKRRNPALQAWNVMRQPALLVSAGSVAWFEACKARAHR